MINAYRKVDNMDYDGLIANITPPIQVGNGTIAAPSENTTYKRGTIFAKSATDNKLYILGSTAKNGDTLTPDCVLCDDAETGVVDIAVAMYTAGCFDPNKVTVAEGYAISESDKDKLRERGIVFKAKSYAN